MDFDGNIFGLLFFAVMILLSIISKVRESRKQEERKQRPEIKRIEELPEEARRRYYGDAETPVAQPRGAEAARPVPAPPQRGRESVPLEEGPSLEELLGRLFDPDRPAPKPQPAPAQRMQPTEQPRRVPAPPQRAPQAQPAQRRMPPTPQRAQQAQPAAQRRMPQARPAQRRESQEGPVMRPSPQARAPQREARPAAAPRSRVLFSGLDDVRRGIILQEVLGPPKSLQGF